MKVLGPFLERLAFNVKQKKNNNLFFDNIWSRAWMHFEMGAYFKQINEIAYFKHINEILPKKIWFFLPFPLPHSTIRNTDGIDNLI